MAIDKETRRRELVQLLLERTRGITGNELAERFHVTTRTIRLDIVSLTKRLEGTKSSLLSAPNHGYRLLKNDDSETLLALFSPKGQGIGLMSAQEQQNYILRRFLMANFAEQSITQASLADEMYVGISTIKTYLQTTRQFLREYSLHLVQYRTEGLRLQGEEGNIRALALEYYQKTNDKALYALLFAKFQEEELRQTLRHVTSINGLLLTDEASESFTMETALALARAAMNHPCILPLSIAQKVEATHEYEIAHELSNAIFQRLGMDVPCNEVFYLAQCLLTSKRIFNKEILEQDLQTENGKHLQSVLVKVLDDIYGKFGLDLRADTFLQDCLLMHLRVALARINFHMGIRNALLPKIKIDYPMAFQIAITAALKFREIDGISFNENEIGYLALHFASSISRNHLVEKPKTALLVCSMNEGISLLLRAELQRKFQGRLKLYGTIPAYEFTAEKAKEVDIVLTTVPLKIEVPRSLLIHPLLQDEDMKRISRLLMGGDPDKEATILHSFFRRDCFYMKKDFKTREECLHFLTDEAMRLGLMNETGKQSVFDRESISATSIGDWAAIPHALTALKDKSSISCLFLQRAVQWGEFPVRVIFLMNIEQSKESLWEKTFSKLYSFIKEKNGLELLVRHPTYEQFMHVFESTL